MESGHLTEVKLLGASLVDGETKNSLVCPKCGGGLNHDRSFSITRVGSTLKYICFRVKCGYRGVVGSKADSLGTKIPKAENRINLYTKEIFQLPEGGREWLLTRYPVMPEAYLARAGFSYEDDRVLYPLTDRHGNRAGWVARCYEEGVTPKTITYWESEDKVRGDFTFFKQGELTYLVEDVISASALGGIGLSAIALLGTNVSDELVTEAWNPHGIYLALDKDALPKALKYEKKFRLMGVKVKVWDSHHDPKDMSPEELREVFLGR
jgi:hypothetical protein